MKPNMLINIIGILLIMIAGVGIAVYEEPEALIFSRTVYKDYNIDFSDFGDSIPVYNDNVEDGQTITVPIDIDINNLTAVSFSITWDDQNPRPVLGGSMTFDVSVTGPASNLTDSMTDSGRSGSFTIDFTGINSKYEDTTVNLDETSKVYDGNLENIFPPLTEGEGTWTVTVSASRSIPRVFGSADFSISTNYEYFKMEISEPSDGSESEE